MFKTAWKSLADKHIKNVCKNNHVALNSFYIYENMKIFIQTYNTEIMCNWGSIETTSNNYQ